MVGKQLSMHGAAIFKYMHTSIRTHAQMCIVYLAAQRNSCSYANMTKHAALHIKLQCLAELF